MGIVDPAKIKLIDALLQNAPPSASVAQPIVEAIQNVPPQVVTPDAGAAKPLIDVWANFLSNHNLTPARTNRPMEMVSLAEELARRGAPAWRPYAARQNARKLVVQAAMDLGIDLASMKHGKGLAMDRALLDAWNAEYASRFGGTYGTPGAKEITRREIVTKLSREKKG